MPAQVMGMRWASHKQTRITVRYWPSPAETHRSNFERKTRQTEIMNLLKAPRSLLIPKILKMRAR
jgi:hypothetical protein